jgi:hypothetical protein
MYGPEGGGEIMASERSTAELIGASPVAHARITGLVGIVPLVSGSFAASVASRLVVRGDAVTTSRNLVASESLFRLGLLGTLIMMIAFLFYALLLYRLLRRVNSSHAKIMVGLVVVSVPIYMLNQVNQYAALLEASSQRYEQVQLFLDLHRLGNLIAGIFFGLWLFPFGLLVYRSGFFPRFLGILLMLGSPGYVILFVQAFVFPGSEGTLWTNPLLVVTHVSEAAMLLWLLFRGLNVDAWDRAVVAV